MPSSRPPPILQRASLLPSIQSITASISEALPLASSSKHKRRMSDDNEKPRRELRLESPEPMMSMDDPTMVVPGLSDDEDSPTRMSEGLLTPPQLPLGYGRSEPILVSGAEHGNGDGLDRRMGYQNASPAMSPMLHPTLSSKPKLMTSHLMRQNSAPTTPKGHPIVEEGYFTSALKQIYPISKPSRYSGATSWYARIPRRYRPVLLAALCIMTFSLIWITHDSHDLMPAYPIEEELAVRHVEPTHEQHAHLFQPEVLPMIDLSPEDEYAALIGFITSSTANSLPPVDPTETLDPSIILDFDPTSPNAKQDLQFLHDEINSLYPIVLFGQMRDPWHREVRAILAEYKITPAPLLVDVDQRRDHTVFSAILARLFGTDELPLLVLNGVSIGSYHKVLELREAGTLKARLEANNSVSVRNAKKKKKGVKERERLENERILAPKPVVDGE